VAIDKIGFVMFRGMLLGHSGARLVIDAVTAIGEALVCGAASVFKRRVGVRVVKVIGAVSAWSFGALRAVQSNFGWAGG
jgi:hypothetical protein